MSDETPSRRPRGLARDFKRAREGGKASAEELRAFVQEFHGKSAREMLGLVSGSALVRATIHATILTIVFMGLFTIGPYLLRDHNAVATVVAPSAPKAPAAPATPAAAPAGTAASAAPPTAAALPATNVPPTAPNVPTDPLAPPGSQADIAKKLGIGETKAADPKKNPLDAGADDLLKDLK